MPEYRSFMDITMNTNTGRMHIQASFDFNDVIRRFPNRRFEKRRQIWVLPIIKRNAEHLLTQVIRLPNVRCHQSVIAAAELALTRGTAPKAEKFPVGYEFKTSPFPHQLDALNFAWGSHYTAFFMEMGTGKTKTFIDMATARYLAAQVDCAVIFVPVAIRTNWVKELAIHCPIAHTAFVCDTQLSSFPKRSEEFLNLDAKKTFKWLIVGIESFQQGLEKGKAYTYVNKFVRCHSPQAGVDESHLVKGHDANRSLNIEMLAAEAEYRTIMTGTPIAQGIMDIYQPFQILSPDIIGLGDFMSFRNRYAEMGGFQDKQIVGYTNTEELMDIIKPFVFQVKKEEVLKDLPPKTYTQREVHLTKEQMAIYAEIKKKRCADLSVLLAHRKDHDPAEFADLVCENVLAAYTALQQIIAGYVSRWVITDEETGARDRQISRIVDPEQNPKVKDLIDVCEANPGRPGIIWAKYRQEIDDICTVLRAKFGDESVVEYHGGIERAQRDINEELFKSGKATYFVSNQQTGGTGLTLNRATWSYYFSNSFALIHRMQSEDRNHRIGQFNSVLYVDSLAKGTVDEQIMAAIEAKMDLAMYVRSRMDRSPAELMALLG